MTDCLTLELWLAEARLALHRLMTGTAEQSVQFGPSKSVTYTQANINQLKDYIAKLENDIAVCNGETPAKRGPVRFIF